MRIATATFMPPLRNRDWLGGEPIVICTDVLLRAFVDRSSPTFQSSSDSWKNVYQCSDMTDKLVLHLKNSDINRAGIYQHWYILPLLFTWTGMMLIARASVVTHQYQFHVSKNSVCAYHFHQPPMWWVKLPRGISSCCCCIWKVSI